MPNPNNILGQNTRNNKFYANNSAPDTDNLAINLATQGLIVIPNLEWNHTIMTYIIPPGTTATITISNVKQATEYSLHYIMISNGNTATTRTVRFGSSHVFLDDPGQTKTVDSGKILAYFGTYLKGKMYWRLSLESTT